MYQLRVYWDGLVLEGIQPTRGILLTSGYSDRLQEMVRILNTLPAPTSRTDGPVRRITPLLLPTRTSRFCEKRKECSDSYNIDEQESNTNFE